MPRLKVFSLILALYCWSADGHSLTLEKIDSARTWRVKNLAISGNQKFSERRLLGEILTKARPWYTPWREGPVFDPVTFEADLKRRGITKLR
ncbi:MAG: hypothetical protein ACREV4_02555 [Gammaproteobacteria bacterium]